MTKSQFIAIFSSIALLAAACSESNSSNSSEQEPPVTPESEVVKVDPIVRVVESTQGCALDNDCAEGTFCFQKICVKQCSAERNTCPDDYLCQASRGLCVTRKFVSEYAQLYASIEAQIEKEVPTEDISDAILPPEGAAALTELESRTIDATNVVRSVIGQTNEDQATIKNVAFRRHMPNVAFLNDQETKKTMTFDAEQPLGDVFYAVKFDDGSVPWLQQAKMTKNADGSYRYAFEIDATQAKAIIARKRSPEDADKSAFTSTEIVSSAGNFGVDLIDAPSLSGLYTGYVVPRSILSGISLPLRVGFTTTPNTAASFTDIKSIRVYMPVSEKDLFSPENVKLQDNKPLESWAWVDMQPSDSCSDANINRCFVATFSTNDFAPYASSLFDETNHVNRAIRLEITDYDGDAHAFTGTLIDKFTGLYRDIAVQSATGSDNQLRWHTTSTTADFMVSYDRAFNEEGHQHVIDNTNERPLDEKVAPTCSDNAVKAILAKLTSPYSGDCGILDDDQKAECKQYAACSAIKSLSTFNALDNDQRWFCLDQSVAALASDDTRLSVILQKVLTPSDKEHADNVVEVCGKEISNFKDFQELCADSTCDLCGDHPEYVCAADLLSDQFINDTSLDQDQKAGLVRHWTSMIRESYLPQQYLAWNADVDIREKWLEGAVYANSFASSIMNKHNDELLARHRNEVLDVQKDVIRKQLHPNTLEMLSSSLINSDLTSVNALNAERSTVLSELADTWQAFGSSLALAARRYDVLSQNDADRLKTAGELRGYLFDLYLAGVLESQLNLSANVGSLNDAYGANLADILTKIASLDQPFESLVFMRDGEVFTDSRLETESTETALGTVRKHAKDLVDKAVEKRKTVFKQLEDKKQNALSTKDQYLSALENIRADIINLCGYPTDCIGEQKSSCKLFVEPNFCGFALSQIDKTGVSLAASDASTISQKVGDYQTCINKLMQGKSGSPSAEAIERCLGANIASTGQSVSFADSTNTSQAGLAILDYRKADEEYMAAVAEYDVLSKKVENNQNTLIAYKQNLETSYAQQVSYLKALEENIATISQYADAQAQTELAILKEKAKSAQDAYDKQKEAVQAWEKLGNAQIATLHAMNSAYAATSATSIYNYISMTTAGYVGMINSMLAFDEQVGALDVDPLLSPLQNDIQAKVTNINATSKRVQKLAMSAEALNAIDQNLQSAWTYKLDKVQMEQTVDLKELQKGLAKAISELTVQTQSGKLSGPEIEAKIKALQLDNEKLIEIQKVEESHQRDLAEFDRLRTEFLNVALDLIPLSLTLKLKELARERALLNYQVICQRAQLLADQYDSKLERYKNVNDRLFSATSFFEYASDLASVESFIEYARNALSDYLTAIEYLTVRPFVELRRAIYTARGTNELDKIYEQLNDLTNKCGSGAQTDNTVTISLRSRLGIPNTPLNRLSPADRFHTILSRGDLPVSAQTRYTVMGGVGEKLIKKHYYSGSFELGKSFANIANSCNAKIDEIQIRFVSKSGQPIRAQGDVTPAVSLFYSGQSQLISCHSNIEAIRASIGARTTFGTYSVFSSQPFADGINASIYEVPEGLDYKLTDGTRFNDVTIYRGLKGYPLMATYTLVFDPKEGSNSKINWDNVADIEIQFKYTTGTLGQDANACKYDL